MGSVNTILTVILVITGGLMTFLIMLQEGKGGGLAALGGTKAAGIEGVTNPIRRATGYMAAVFFLLAIVLGVVNRPTNASPIGGNEEETSAATTATTTESGPSATVVAPAIVPATNINNAAPANNATTQKTTTEKAPDATKPDATKPDATKPDATKPDAQKAEPAKTEAGKTDANKTEAPKADANKTEPAKTDSAKPAEQPKPDTKGPEQK